MGHKSGKQGLIQLGKGWLKRRGYHLLFAGAIVSLLALVLWWTTFIRNSINEMHELHHESMVQSASVLALSMGHDPDTQPVLGPIEHDVRLEVIECSKTDPQCSTALTPYWPEFCIAPRREYEDQLEAELRSKTVMVFGESSLMLLVVLVAIFMLWRLMRLERRAQRELHEFWGRVTHELKTPITGIKAFLQTLQQRSFSRAELEPLLKMSLREVERQEMLAENLLMGQRIERQGRGLQVRPVKLAMFVREFIEEHRMILPDENLVFELTCPEDSAALADPDALRVILENLTDNALKYGGASPHLTYRISAADNEAQISVSDRGVGFAPEQAEHIFDAYQRLSEEQPKGRHGTGMGLHISRQLASKMGGSLRAHSDGENQGASFIIALKRAHLQNV